MIIDISTNQALLGVALLLLYGMSMFGLGFVIRKKLYIEEVTNDR